MEIPQKAWNKRVISLTVSPQIATLNFKKQTNIYEPIIAIGYLWTKKTDSANQPTDSKACLLYTSPSPRDTTASRMPSSA